MFLKRIRFNKKSFGRQGCEFTLCRNRFSISDVLLLVLLISFLLILYKPLTKYLHTFQHAENNIQEDVVVLLIILTLLCLTVLFTLYNQALSESIIVVASVGISIKTVNGLGGMATEFISINQIMDVVIIEAISMQSVVCNLAIILKGENENEQKLFPLFKNMKPDLKTQQTIYRSIQKVLHPGSKLS